MTDQERIVQLERELELLKQLVALLQAQIVAHVCPPVTYPVYPEPYVPFQPYQTTWGNARQVNNGDAAMTDARHERTVEPTVRVDGLRLVGLSVMSVGAGG